MGMFRQATVIEWSSTNYGGLTIHQQCMMYCSNLQMYGGNRKEPTFVLYSAHVVFCLATATTCTSPSKLPTFFGTDSVS